VASLRTRLVATTVAVAAIAVAGVALLSRHAVRVEYARLNVQVDEDWLPRLAAALDAQLPPDAGRAEVDVRLAALGKASGRRLVLLGPDGAPLGVSSASLAAATFRRTGDRLVIETTEGGSRRQMLLVGAPHAEVTDAAGRARGTLVALPPDRESAEPPFVATIDRRLLVAALLAIAAALALSLAVARRILGPVEAITAAARRMAAGDLTGRVAVSSSDEIGTLARAFNGMADAVARAESLRRGLVTDVAHELRTPLTNLRCQVEALQDGLQPADATSLRSLHEETLLLARLVGDLEDLALAESGQLPLHLARVAAGDLVAASLAAIRPIAAGRGIALRAEVDPPALELTADRERLAQVLRNLLANALTHTPDGGAITVSARQDGGTAAIVVADTGRGIDPEHLPHVFERFYRADPSRARATGGAGLGLAIVKYLVEAHGGSVAAESAAGAGARFTITLPASRDLHAGRVFPL
jgi:signal transduction histidine kinase